MTRESEWDDEQRALILALAVYQAGLCQRCGGELAETTNTLHDADNPHGTHVYRLTRRKRCHQCTASMQAEHEWHSNKLVNHPDAVQHYVELMPRGVSLHDRRPRPPRAQQT